MKFDKKYILLISILGLLIVGLLIYYFTMDTANNVSFNNGNHGGLTNNQTSNLGENVIVNNDPIYVNDVNVYFNINELINHYYKSGIEKQKNELINLLDKGYIALNGINTNNVISKVASIYDEVNFYSREIYEKNYGKVKYYFVTGENQEYDFSEETLYEKENINFMIIVDTNNKTYSIYPLIENDIKIYAKNYTMISSKKVSSNGYNTFSFKKYEAEEIAKKYLLYFKNVMYLNTEKAYSMLEDSYKNTFGNLENFYSELNTIYSSIKCNGAAFGENQTNNQHIYSFIMSNDKIIYLYEESPMSFKVAIQ